MVPPPVAGGIGGTGGRREAAEHGRRAGGRASAKGTTTMIRAGIAGLGRWGQTLVDSVQGVSDQITFTAGCTGRKARAEDYCKQKGIDLRDSLDDLLADPEIDAVVLATPHTQHVDQVAAAAAAGKQIFVEKPFTLARADAERAVKAADDAGVVLALGHQRRFHPGIEKLREMVLGGEFGTLMHIEGNISSPRGVSFDDEHWRSDPDESPAGGLTGLGIHMIDAFISLVGEIREVRAVSHARVITTGIDDTTFATFRFENGMTGYMGTLFATPMLWTVRLFGSEAWAEMRDYSTLVIRRRDAQADEVIELGPFDMERAELEAFAAACAGGPPFPLPTREAIHGVAVLEAVIETAARGGARAKDIDP